MPDDDVLDIPFADAYRFDPSPTWERLREERPIVRVRTLAGAVVWLVTRYDDVRVVLSDRRFSRSRTVGTDAPRVAVARPLPGTLPTTDPPEHTRLHRLVANTFARSRVEVYRPWVRELTERFCDDIAAAGEPADLRQLLALPLPVQVICQLLGVPYEDRPRFREWTELAYSMSMEAVDAVNAAMASLHDYLRDLIAEKEKTLASGREPSDLLDELVAPADPDADRLSAEELVAFGVNLLVAGHETSANQIASFVATLLRDHHHWERLVAEPDLVPSAVEELLRFTRLSEMGQLRVAAEDVEIAGQLVRAGDGVMAALGSANRDPRAFENPDELDLARASNRHVAFGYGIHFCIGAPLARIELQECLWVLLKRFPGLRLTVPAEDLPWRKVLVSGLAEVPVAWS